MTQTTRQTPKTRPPLIGVTMGDPAGIGAEIILKAAASLTSERKLLVLGDVAVLSETARRLNIPLVPVSWQVGDPYPIDPALLPVLALSQLPVDLCAPGQPTAAGGAASYRYVETGVHLTLDHTLAGLVTAPISKAMWHAAGYAYPGHTELLARLTGASDVRMMLVGDRLRVVLVTTHIALAQVPAALSHERIARTITVAAAHLSRFHKFSAPRLAVAGLNPHAGEAGAFGDEEERIIAPAVRQARAQGVNVDGPFPADSIFIRAVSGDFDAVICLYHDQGLIPLKLLAWETGVNVTIGLPIVRTSPDHGTAFDIAGQGRADPRSMIAAISLAEQMAAR